MWLEIPDYYISSPKSLLNKPSARIVTRPSIQPSQTILLK